MGFFFSFSSHLQSSMSRNSKLQFMREYSKHIKHNNNNTFKKSQISKENLEWDKNKERQKKNSMSKKKLKSFANAMHCSSSFRWLTLSLVANAALFSCLCTICNMKVITLSFFLSFTCSMVHWSDLFTAQTENLHKHNIAHMNLCISKECNVEQEEQKGIKERRRKKICNDTHLRVT